VYDTKYHFILKYYILFIHSTIDRHLCYFYVLALPIVSQWTWMYRYFWVPPSKPFGSPLSGLLGHTVILSLIFLRNCRMFHNSHAVPSTVHKVSSFYTTSPTLVIFGIFFLLLLLIFLAILVGVRECACCIHVAVVLCHNILLAGMLSAQWRLIGRLNVAMVRIFMQESRRMVQIRASPPTSQWHGNKARESLLLHPWLSSHPQLLFL
jgi:hypothetical protein